MTRARAALAAALLLLLLAGLGRLPLIDPDEGRYARAAQEMLARGEWIVPVLDGLPRLQKPILFYWLEKASFSLLGFTELAARLPSALAAAGTLVVLWRFARPRLGERTALTACAVLATTPLFHAMARTATTDMTLTFFVVAATTWLHEGIVEPGRARAPLILGGAALGLGLLTKGPVALLVPALALPAAAVARRREPITIAGRATTAAWTMTLVAVPWTLALFHRLGWENVLGIWRRETLERLESGLDHPEPLTYFLVTTPILLLPWSALLPCVVLGAIRRMRWGEGLAPLLLAWLVGGFVFFSLGRGKLDSYLLPLTPAAALLVAVAVSGEEPAARLGRWAVWTMTLIAAGLAVPPAVGHEVDDLIPPIAALGVALLALVLTGLALSRRAAAIPGVLAGVAGALLLAASLLLPASLVAHRTGRDLARAPGLAGFDGPVYAHRVHSPSLKFYLDRATETIPARYLLLKVAEGPGAAAVVLPEGRASTVTALLHEGFRPAARSGGRLVLLRRSGTPGAPP